MACKHMKIFHLRAGLSLEWRKVAMILDKVKTLFAVKKSVLMSDCNISALKGNA